MTIQRLAADEVGLPKFAFAPAPDAAAFDLSSHQRAREAIEIGLAIDDVGFNVFVVGEDRSGRMTATLDFLQQHVAKRPLPHDWVYLNNFRRPHRPTPYRLPAGVGRAFRDRMADAVRLLREAIARAVGDEGLHARIRAMGDEMQGELSHAFAALRADAEGQGFEMRQSEQGTEIVALGPDGEPLADEALPPERRQALADTAGRVAAGMRALNREAADLKGRFEGHIRDLNRQAADAAIAPYIDDLIRDYGSHRGLTRWLVGMRGDILDHLDSFTVAGEEAPGKAPEPAERRYAVNLLVDHSDDPHPQVVLEPSPTYENLFGRIEYRPVEGGMVTDFTMIRAGSLHRANGGILVVRAEALVEEGDVWGLLKGALRDGEIRIEEMHRANAMPVAGAPSPKPVPLELKLVIVGAPRWYYAMLSMDPDFQTYVKIKADIDPDMDATPENLACYAGLINRMAQAHRKDGCEDSAVRRLLGVAARWAGRRTKLTAKFELIEDVVGEAAALVGADGRTITDAAIVQALLNRRRRNARAEDRFQEAIATGSIMIATDGRAVGQVNALTVRDLGDHEFGSPARVSARGSAGRDGIINVERDVELGGPIQQKGVMVLQGFLSGKFARRFPLSFNCSITFEQSYGAVEGDSASLAELLAILSDLSGVPLRQDLAVTGSANQHGEAQPIGGVYHKIEGFFRTCFENGGSTGMQGVVIPAPNRRNVILHDDAAAAVADGRFHVYAVATVDEAIELFTGLPAGTPDANGDYPPDTIYGKVAAQLAAFDSALAERAVRM
ncbi:MAG: Lon protease family protein [Rhodospirillales bacterium]